MRVSSATDRAACPEPGWLQTEAGAAFCWYHPPEGAARDIAVLLCDPLGSDRMNLHLAYRHLALALAMSGIATLRLDYPGTCDAEGRPGDPDRISALFTSLHAGADYLRQRSGVQRLALFGARFGGTLALAFAAQREDVSLASVWGAYAGGRQFLRVETAFERLSHANPDQRRPTAWQEGDIEAAGFRYSAQNVADLRALALGEVAHPGVDEALLIDWDAGEGSGDVADLLHEQGVAVTTLEAADSGAESLHRQRVPSALIGNLRAWLLARSEQRTTSKGSDEPLRQEIRLPLATGGSIEERCVRFGEHEELFGILTLPADAHRSATADAIVLVNGGNNHRVGINRNHTEWARLWAGEGYAVLRMDIRGLGDSPPRRPSDLNRLYLDQTENDLIEAAEWLRTSASIDRLIFCGLCAGAYQILQFARRRQDISAVMLLELLRLYRWEPLQTPAPPLIARVRRWWARLHPMWLVDRYRLGKWLLGMCRSGTRCLVLYREDERMLGRFRAELSKDQAALAQTGNFQLSELGASNHIISPLWAQEELTGLLTDYVRKLRG